MNRKRWATRGLGGAVLFAAAMLVTSAVAPADPVGDDAGEPLTGPAPMAGPVNETVMVDASNPFGNTSVSVLQPGTTYSITVAGTYYYGLRLAGGASGQADAECSDLPPDASYQRNRFALLDPGEDLLDLYVNGKNVEWQPTLGDAFGCNSTDHTYTIDYTPDVAGPVHFRPHDTGYSDNFGTFTVQIVETAEVFVESLQVPSNSPAGTNTTSLSSTKRYRFEASGTFVYGVPGTAADARCAGLEAGGPWVANLWGPALSPTDPSQRPLGLYVNRQPADWQAIEGSPAGCSDTIHTYEHELTPGANGPVNLAVFDSNYGDNTGILEVDVYEVVAAAPKVAPLALPSVQIADQVTVDSSNPGGSFSAIPVVQGQSYLFEASGTYWFGLGPADASCSATTTDPTFVRNRYGNDALTLLVNNAGVDWVPVEAAAPQCSDSHTYRTIFQPTTTGLVGFRISDGFYGDNSGALTVKIFRIREIELAPVAVNSTSTQDAPSIPLAAGRSYRFSASGTYSYWNAQPAARADAACAQAGFSPYNDFTYQRNRFGNGLLSLLVNGGVAAWQPRDQSPGGCDATHVYSLVHTPAAHGSVGFRVFESSPFAHSDNSGVLFVQIFLRTT